MQEHSANITEVNGVVVQHTDALLIIEDSLNEINVLTAVLDARISLLENEFQGMTTLFPNTCLKYYFILRNFEHFAWFVVYKKLGSIHTCNLLVVNYCLNY